MIHFQHVLFRSYSFRGVVGREVGLHLGYYLAAVAHLAHPVHGEPGLFLAGFAYRLMHMMAIHTLAAVLGKQGWVDVYHAVVELFYQEIGHHEQKSGQHNEVNVVLREQCRHLLVAVEPLLVQVDGRHPQSFGALERTGIGLVA